ncbi:hypothetical protein HK405_013135 [Cladochytrium tenue]|nr:hypothetical protein HK405_013135 [Cladochytrium tenue]
MPARLQPSTPDHLPGPGVAGANLRPAAATATAVAVAAVRRLRRYLLHLLRPLPLPQWLAVAARRAPLRAAASLCLLALCAAAATALALTTAWSLLGLPPLLLLGGRRAPSRPAPVFSRIGDCRGFPMLVHQSWKDENVPTKFGTWPASWRDLNEGWEYHLWTDLENRDLIVEHFPWLLRTYDALPHNVMRADLARYAYMFHYGGAYADLDMELVQPLSRLINVTAAADDDDTVDACTSLAFTGPSGPEILWLSRAQASVIDSTFRRLYAAAIYPVDWNSNCSAGSPVFSPEECKRKLCETREPGSRTFAITCRTLGSKRHCKVARG